MLLLKAKVCFNGSAALAEITLFFENDRDNFNAKQKQDFNKQ